MLKDDLETIVFALVAHYNSQSKEAKAYHRIKKFCDEAQATSNNIAHGGSAQICPICEGRGWNKFKALSVSASKEPFDVIINQWCGVCKGTGKLHHA